MLEMNDQVDSKFRFILLAAKRARQLQTGAKPLIHTSSRKPTRIAQEELTSGVLKWELLDTALSRQAVPEEAPAVKEKG
ncbi:MAG: DNA-directed RNA polymerase subunit omega [Acidobacteria bacterium RIFCSPLOWO2_02_FULL_59_13]|nr:MAG: DNA-directed RNA polymerase subunit omega [Acidobacteria bacterium RIFCSPLOWO2_02_FULL_59_13]